MSNPDPKKYHFFIDKQSVANVFYYKVAGFTIIFFSFFSAMQVYNWPLLKYWGVKGHINFADLNSVLGSADCFRTIGFAIYDYPIGHECAYNYGSWLMRSISALGLKESHTDLIGWFFIFGLSFLLAIVVGQVKTKPITLLLGFFVFLSPPVMLLLERGNFDILIIFLIFISAMLMKYKKINLGIVLVFASFLYKFYTAGLALLVTLFLRNAFTLVFWITLFGLGIFQVFFDFQRGPGFINTEQNSFGSPIFGIYLKYLGFELPYLFSLLLGLILVVIGVRLFSLKNSPTRKCFVDLKDSCHDLFILPPVFLFFIVVHTTSYILGMNFDYRLIMVAIANYIMITQSKLAPHTRNSLGIITVLIMWTSFNFKFLQPIGDVLIWFITVHYIFLIWWFILSTHRGNVIFQFLMRLFHKSA